MGFGLATPLQMTLVDQSGSLSGQSGGGVDCRYFQYCGSFGTYTVTGSHDRTRVSLRGLSSSGRTWTLTGTLAADGQAMAGIATGEFPAGPWQMTRSR